MAIYHLSGQVISRSTGRSSVAASAYRSGEKLLDERTGLTHDFSHKSDVVEKAILLPEGSPERFSDRSTLWNEVEKVEKRKDAQLAREFNIALPKELSQEQNWALAKDYVQSEFVDKGMIADVAMHSGHKGNEEQPHVHVMLTMREVGPEGFCQKNRSWNDKALLQHWRESWAEHANRGLARHGFDQRIDHRTLDAQGINLEPQTKIGPKPSQENFARFEEHQRTANRNGERIANDPSIALDAITKQQSTFTHQDVAKFVNRHTSTPEQFEQVYAKVKGHESVVTLGIDGDGHERMTTQAMLVMEQRMVRQAVDQAQGTRHRLDSSAVQSTMASRSLSQEQTQMLTHITQGQDIACVVGVAGTGKSYTLDAAREAWETQGYQVKGMTLSGKAAEELEASSGIESRTVASYEHGWNQERDALTANMIIVVDEAGMLGSRQMSRIMDEASKVDAKVVLVGDPEQLQAIGAGAAYRAIAERTGFVELSEVRRQHHAWQRQATQDFAKAGTEQGLATYEKQGCVHDFDTKDDAKAAMVDRWQEARSAEPDKTQLMLAYTREDVKDLNARAREIREGNGELGKRATFEVHHFTEKNDQVVVEKSQREFAVNDKLYFLKNDREMGIKNGTLGTVTGIDQDKLSVSIDRDGRQVEVNTQFYKHLDHGYATTVHKSQAGTYDRTHVLASPHFDRHTTYVAMSRHRDSAELYWSRDAFKNDKALVSSMSREQLKDTSLDYQRQDYSQRRGFETEKPSMVVNRSATMAQRDYAHFESPTDKQARLREAEARMEKRAFERDVSRIEKNVGLSLSTDIKAGDKGIYQGMVEVKGQRYGVMDMGKGQGKLVPRDMMESRHPGKAMEIESTRNRQGRDQLKAVQPYERQRSLGRDYGGIGR